MRRITATIAVGAFAFLAPAAAADAATMRASADTTTSSSTPRATAGRAHALRVDARPDRRAHVRFRVPELGGDVASATLRIHVTRPHGARLTARRISGAGWAEHALSHATRPRLTGPGASSRRVTRRGWVAIDVTGLVRRNGVAAFALTTSSRRELRASSREAGRARAPRITVRVAAPRQPPADAPAGAPGWVRPYDQSSAWNTPIGPRPALDPSSATYVRSIADNGRPLTSDPDQYAIPVYRVHAGTPRREVRLSGYFSAYDRGDASRRSPGLAPRISDVPVPEDAVQSSGTDGQIVLWDPDSGVEYSFWRFARTADGGYTATNGYRYHTGPGYHGRFADGKAGRGAGTPYLAGLVRRWEIDRGRIDHALAFAYDAPSSAFVFPASKSDGNGLGTDAPEGARLQLDPALTDADFDRWGLSAAGRTIARALQTYGMYVVDNSGSSKIFLEDRKTAGWGPGIGRDLTRPIPWSAFRVVAPPPR